MQNHYHIPFFSGINNYILGSFTPTTKSMFEKKNIEKKGFAFFIHPSRTKLPNSRFILILNVLLY